MPWGSLPYLSDPHHISRFEPGLCSHHQNVSTRIAGATGRIRTMTSNYSLTGIKAFALGAALSMTAGLAPARDNVISAGQSTRAVQPKPVTRGRSAAPP